MVKITGSEEDKSTLQKFALLLADHIYDALNKVNVVTIFDQTYLDLLRRIRASLFGLSSQLPLWPEVYEMKVPIELLLRTMLTDSLTLLYLTTFQDSEESFTNELSLLDAQVVKYLEVYIDNYELIDDTITNTDKEVKKEMIYKLVPHIRNKDDINRPRSFREIRENSESTLFLAKSNTEAGFNKALTERAMFEQLKSHPDTNNLAYLYVFQRLFSQTHHYARYNRSYINWDTDHVCLNWFIAIHGIYHVVDVALNLLGANDEIILRIQEDRFELAKYIAD